MISRSGRGYAGYRRAGSPGRRVRRLFGFVVLVFVIHQFVTAFVVQSVVHQTVVMVPTLRPGERFLAIPLAYGPRLRVFDAVLPGVRAPGRGELAVIRPGYVPRIGVAARLADPFLRFFTLGHRRVDDGDAWDSSVQIKRIIGLPGDTIRIERFIAYVRPAGAREFANEFALSARGYDITTGERPTSWQPLDPFGASAESITLGDDEYFVLSDDRGKGLDSRHWGTITTSDLVSRLWIRYWPLRRFGRP